MCTEQEGRDEDDSKIVSLADLEGSESNIQKRGKEHELHSGVLSFRCL